MAEASDIVAVRRASGIHVPAASILPVSEGSATVAA
ncbi:hypothetical protein QE410_000140 [Microbacterium sp. SORGH_AS 1204]|nr:hypothetical protein [Microbacterium sp. SORGH_AS_1204]